MSYGDLTVEQAEALMTKIGGAEGVRKLLSGQWIAGEPVAVQNGAPGASGAIIADLLEIVENPVKLPPVGRFVVRDKFVAGRDGELPLSYVGEDFAAKFHGIVEENIGAAALTQHRLIKASIDVPILAALGGEAGAKIALAHLFAFLKTADRSRWYFFYVTDANGTLWAVDSYWRDGGWDLEAYSATYPRGWRGGGHVVARSHK